MLLSLAYVAYWLVGAEADATLLLWYKQFVLEIGQPVLKKQNNLWFEKKVVILFVGNARP